jgi:hypothetical protein
MPGRKGVRGVSAKEKLQCMNIIKSRRKREGALRKAGQREPRARMKHREHGQLKAIDE